MGPFDNTKKLKDLINKLHIDDCNLPECSAIASFLFNRREVPIFDRYISLFFARDFNDKLVKDDTTQVLCLVNRIGFKNVSGGVRKDGSKKLRPDIYGKYNKFKDNLEKYIEFVNECKRISEYLNQSNIHYRDIHDKMIKFCPVDIEMAIFSYSTQHKGLF